MTLLLKKKRKNNVFVEDGIISFNFGYFSKFIFLIIEKCRKTLAKHDRNSTFLRNCGK